MTDYERGTPAWDIGMILTRHNDGHTKGQHHDFAPCARVLELRRSAAAKILPTERLRLALAEGCTCGAGDSESETTSMGYVKEVV